MVTKEDLDKMSAVELLDVIEGLPQDTATRSLARNLRSGLRGANIRGLGVGGMALAVKMYLRKRWGL